MPQMRLTAAAVDKLKPPASGRVEYWDIILPGFLLRVTDKGRKTWAVMSRVGARRVRTTLGTYPALDLADAREKAREALIRMAKGENPIAEKRRRRAAPDRSFGAMVDLFLERHAKPRQRPRSYDETQRNLRKYFVDKKAKRGKAKGEALKPCWRNRDIGDITRADVIARLDEISEVHGPIQANRCFAALRKFFNWCIASRSLLERSPCDRLEPPSKERKRKRFFKDEEIPALWNAAEAEGYPFGHHLRLALLLGGRRTEIAQMRRSEVNLETGMWELPAGRVKNDIPQTVPLPDQALTIIKDAIARAGERARANGVEDCPWVLTSTGAKPIRNITKATKAMTKVTKLDDPWSTHTCRHTVRTQMSGLGVPENIIRKVLNHKESGVSEGYDHYSYDAEKKSALQRWADKVERLVQGVDNVVELRKA